AVRTSGSLCRAALEGTLDADAEERIIGRPRGERRACQRLPAPPCAARGSPVVRLELDDESAVRERRVTARQAHAVDDDALGVGAGRHDESARTHAEAVDAASVDLRRELVERRRHLAGVAQAAVLARIQPGLGMLDADADREALRL